MHIAGDLCEIRPETGCSDGSTKSGMSGRVRRRTEWKALRLAVLSCFVACLCSMTILRSSFAQTSTAPTVITIGSAVQRAGIKHLGINLGGETYYDSRQILNNLLSRNPGFEGESWQSIFHCAAVSATTCVDDNKDSFWAANFFQGANVEFITGSIVGATAQVASSTAVVPAADYASRVGVTLTFSTAIHPAVGDYLVVRMLVPGNAQAGWATSTGGAGTVTTELSDLPPGTLGKQAIRVTAPGTATASVVSYFDSTAARSFIQLNGSYTLAFRAKLVSGVTPMNAGVTRLGTGSYLNVKPALTTSWQDFSYTFTASETNVLGTAQVSFDVANGAVLIDDVSLTKGQAADNPTAFRDEVVTTLRTLKPGVLRYMDNGTDWGSSIDNMLVPAMGRLRAGYSNYNSEADDIPIGLHEFMVLCQAVGAEPWYTMPAGMSTTEMQNLMDYLGGSSSTVYGARRAALGQATPWTTVFPSIHLELGNEVWNTANPGATMTDPVSYGRRAGVLFGTAKASASYSASVIDLVVDGWESAPVWTKPMLAASSNYDTVSQAAYIFGPFTDDSS